MTSNKDWLLFSKFNTLQNHFSINAAFLLINI